MMQLQHPTGGIPVARGHRVAGRNIVGLRDGTGEFRVSFLRAGLVPNRLPDRRYKVMKRITASLAVLFAAGLGSWTASAAEEKEETIKLTDAPAAVQKTINEKAAGAKIVRVEKEHEHGKTVYEAVVSKDGKETGIEVAEDGTYLSSHDEAQEREGGK
jgi:hypothetical protein